MQHATLINLREKQVLNPNGVHKQAINFIDCLLNNNVSLDKIDVNDWGNSRSVLVFITKTDRNYKRYKNQFNALTLKNALKWIKS